MSPVVAGHSDTRLGRLLGRCGLGPRLGHSLDGESGRLNVEARSGSKSVLCRIQADRRGLSGERVSIRKIE